MTSNAATPDLYIAQLPDERKAVLTTLRNTVLTSLPVGFEEVMNYGMIGFVVPLSIYPDGYLGNKSIPLPFISIASQKNFVAFYHLGIYADKALLDWFLAEYPKYTSQKLDMGKSCIRFKKLEAIPYALIGELCSKIGVSQWVELYENSRSKDNQALHK